MAQDARALMADNASGQRFRYVETPLITAIRFMTRSVRVSTSGSSMSMIRFILEMTDWFMSRQPA